MYKKILNEIDGVLSKVNPSEIKKLVDTIKNVKGNIIVCGAGRMGYSIQAFGMRLSHLGFSSFTLGDSNVPRTSKDDLVIIASGSGETRTMKVIAERALSTNTPVFLITSSPDSTIATMASDLLVLPANSSLNGSSESIQPMKTYIEQSTLILYDMIALHLMNELKISNNDMSQRHSILE